ncbi:predicted protein [Postia placenta Mad-698-R]|nr:predicted protein [Postia placenta Mad-698-R]
MTLVLNKLNQDILDRIFLHFDDFATLSAAIRTCEAFYNVFCSRPKSILNAIAANIIKYELPAARRLAREMMYRKLYTVEGSDSEDELDLPSERSYMRMLMSRREAHEICHNARVVRHLEGLFSLRFWLYCLVFEIHDDEEACDPVNSMEHLNAYSTLELFEIHRVAKFLVELIAWTASVEENIPVHSPQLADEVRVLVSAGPKHILKDFKHCRLNRTMSAMGPSHFWRAFDMVMAKRDLDKVACESGSSRAIVSGVVGDKDRCCRCLDVQGLNLWGAANWRWMRATIDLATILQSLGGQLFGNWHETRLILAHLDGRTSAQYAEMVGEMFDLPSEGPALQKDGWFRLWWIEYKRKSASACLFSGWFVFMTNRTSVWQLEFHYDLTAFTAMTARYNTGMYMRLVSMDFPDAIYRSAIISFGQWELKNDFFRVKLHEAPWLSINFLNYGIQGNVGGVSVTPSFWSSTVCNEKQNLDQDHCKFIQTHFNNKIIRGYPVAEFAEAVWGYNCESIPPPVGSACYIIPHDLANSYCTSSEREAFTHLASIMQTLIEQILPGGGTLEGRPRAYVRNARHIRDNKMVASHAVRPDVAWSTRERPESDCWRSSWRSCLAFGEIRRGQLNPLALSQDIEIRSGQSRQPMKTGSSLSGCDNSPSARGFSSESTKRKRFSNDMTNLGPKRHCFLHSGHLSGISQSRLDTTPLHRDEELAARYVMEMMNRTLRSFASGFSVNGTQMTLWYADRVGVVLSAPFDLFQQPELLVLVLAALGSADLTKLGFNPFFEFPDPAFRPYGERMVLPADLVHDAEDYSRNAGGMRLNDSTIGQSTSIYAIKAAGKARVLFGAGNLAVKISWPPSSEQVLEHAKLAVVRRRMREKAPRYLRLLVLKAYMQLQFISSIEEFKTVYIDVVRAHHWVFEKAAILHGDISEGNVMFYREAGRTYGVLVDWDRATYRNTHDEARDDLEGVDLDIESRPTKIQRVDVPLIWGTPIFMAIALQRPSGRPLPRYHHDLEAFFWLLVWFCTSFQPEETAFHSASWCNSSRDEELGLNKKTMLEDDAYWASETAAADEPYGKLLKEWALPLREPFALATNLSDKIYTLRGCIDDAQCCGQWLAARILAKNLKTRIEERKDAISYEKFLAILGAPADIPA